MNFTLRTVSHLLALVGSLVTTAAYAEQPPEPAAARNFTLPATQTLTLDNGLKVTLIPYGKIPKTTIMLQFMTGNQHDGQHPGLSDMTFGLLTQGAGQYSATQIAEQAASMGGQFSTQVGMNSSSVSVDVLSEFAPQASSLLATLVTEALFEEAQLQRAVENRWREIQVSQSQPQGQAQEAFYNAMYPEHPYGITYPTEAQLTSISRTDVTGFADRYLAARNAHLYVAGVFDSDALLPAIRQAFSAMPEGQASEPAGQPPVPNEPVLVSIPRASAPQSTVRLGQRTIAMDHPDYVPLEVMNTLLGGMFSSRITTNIREDKGYTYSPRSAVFSFKDASVWFETADIEAQSTGEALNEIIGEIERLQHQAPPEAELSGVKNYLSGSFVRRNSSRYGVIGQLVTLSVHDLPLTRLTEYISLVNAVDADTISNMAREYLNLQNMSLVIVGDEAQMDEELATVKNLPILKN